jgi:hypothetical protein
MVMDVGELLSDGCNGFEMGTRADVMALPAMMEGKKRLGECWGEGEFM